MRIRLINFRCYDDNTFDLDNTVLISAQSGSGKSSILLGIQYGLYGSKLKGTTIVKYGKPSCSIEIEYDNLVIRRTSKPVRLMVIKDVNHTYEDDEAQGIINKIFGDCFITTSYITQNFLNSFIVMSPSDKLDFLERFTFKDVDITDIKERCKKAIQQRNNELLQIASQKAIVEELLKEKNKPELPIFPYKCKAIDRIKFYERENIRINNIKAKYKKAETALNNIDTEIQSHKMLHDFLDNKNDEHERINIKISNIIHEISINEYKGNKYISELKSKINSITNKRQLNQLQQSLQKDSEKLTAMKISEMTNWTTEKINLVKMLSSYESKDELKDTIISLKESLKDAIEISKLEQTRATCDVIISQTLLSSDKLINTKKELEDYKNRLEICTIKQQLYKCPCCDNMLRLNNGLLEVYSIENDDVEDKEYLESMIKVTENMINNLYYDVRRNTEALEKKKIINDKIIAILSEYESDVNLNEKDIRDEIKTSERDIEKVKDITSRINDIEYKIQTENYSNIIKSFILSIEETKREIETLISEPDIEVCESEDTLRALLEEQISYKHKYDMFHLQLNELKLELDNTSLSIENRKSDYIAKFGSISDIVDLTLKRQNLLDDMLRYDSDIVLYTNNINIMNKYFQIEDECKSYDNLKLRLEDIKTDELNCKKRHVATKLFRESVLNAESIAVGKIIDIINMHAQLYLDYFFPDEPITVMLKTFKETKKGIDKAQINVDIIYRSQPMDIETLSGGELSRVILAFTLALNEISGSPLIMLDECTSSLDQELAGVVFDAIQKEMKNKTCLIIGHQIVEGTFDKIIKL